MATALDVAKYFLSRLDCGLKEQPTQMELYKLVYYAQAWTLTLLGRPMFEGEIQAWKHGPVPVDLVQEYKVFGKEPIPKPSSITNPNETFEETELEVLEAVWDVYGHLSASELRALSHSEHPWNIARAGLGDDEYCQEVILNQEMMGYYSNFVTWNEGHPKISQEATSLNKKIKITLEKKNGELVSVPLDEVEEYIWNNKGTFATEILSGV